MPVWRPNGFPMSVSQNPASGGAGGVLDQRHTTAPGDVGERVQVAGQTHLVDADDGAGFGSDGGFGQFRIQIKSLWLDVGEDRERPAIADGAGGGDKRVTGGGEFVARVYSSPAQGPGPRGGAPR